jgi:hypothetical protein
MKSPTTIAFIMLVLIGPWTDLSAQKKILVDVGHGQKFYSDPADMISTELVPTDRLKYMIGELTKNGAAHNAIIGYLKAPVTTEALSKVDLLFIHTPSNKYSDDECTAIRQFVEKGGALLIVIEEDYWATLSQVNANDIVSSFGITFKSDSPDTTVGGHSVPGKVTKKKYSIPFHGARVIEGGKPFAFSNAPNAKPFGVYAEIKGGGKVVAMGEGMASLYMTSWQGITDYQCAGFMDDVVGWLLE